MPATPAPVIDPRWGPHWSAVLQAMQAMQQQINQLTAGSTQGNLLDGAGNTVEVAGTNLSQVVTIGAVSGAGSDASPGVMVGTGLTGAGRAFQQGLVTGLINLTAGSTAATLTTSPTNWLAGMVIGAADVTDPTSGTATPAIVPGTTITVASGTALTLSQAAAETGTGLYCAACYWRTLAGLNYP